MRLEQLRTETPAAGTLVVAHRGASADLPENTLAAFEEAVRVGADMIELDVRRSGDGQLVAYHDPIGRLRHDALRVKCTSSRPPLLRDVISQLAGRIALNVELKERGCVDEVVSLLAAVGAGQCLLSSFLDDVVDEAKTVAPQFQSGLIVARGPAEQAVLRAQRCHADCLILALALADPTTLTHAVAANLPCLVWTVNDPVAIDRFLADTSIAGVITDRPSLALERRRLISDRTAPATPLRVTGRPARDAADGGDRGPPSSA